MTNKKHYNDLDEGSLYVFQKGELREIEQDPDDLTKKIRLTPEAFAAASDLQKKLRIEMKGYRPDMITICSALVEYAASSPSAMHVVREFALRLFNAIQEPEL